MPNLTINRPVTLLKPLSSFTVSLRHFQLLDALRLVTGLLPVPPSSQYRPPTSTALLPAPPSYQHRPPTSTAFQGSPQNALSSFLSHVMEGCFVQQILRRPFHQCSLHLCFHRGTGPVVPPLLARRYSHAFTLRSVSQVESCIVRCCLKSARQSLHAEPEML
jgi:hypothetical protein